CAFEASQMLKQFFKKKRIASDTASKRLEQVREELLIRKNQFEELLSMRAQEEPDDNSGKDAGDQASSSTMSDLKRSLQDTEFQEYNRIVQALEKIKDGSYGICVDCEGLILEKRLQFYPNAERCLSCQEAFEDTSVSTP